MDSAITPRSHVLVVYFSHDGQTTKIARPLVSAPEGSLALAGAARSPHTAITAMPAKKRPTLGFTFLTIGVIARERAASAVSTRSHDR